MYGALDCIKPIPRPHHDFSIFSQPAPAGRTDPAASLSPAEPVHPPLGRAAAQNVGAALPPRSGSQPGPDRDQPTRSFRINELTFNERSSSPPAIGKPSQHGFTLYRRHSFVEGGRKPGFGFWKVRELWIDNSAVNWYIACTTAEW